MAARFSSLHHTVLLSWLLATGIAHAADEVPNAAADVHRLVEPCAECHGPQGVSSEPGVPSLAGQNAHYLLEELEELHSALRSSEKMNPIAARLRAEDLPAIAKHFAALPYVRHPQTIAADKVARGREAYERICQLCHPDDGKATPYAEYPLLAGQDLVYMQRTMAAILAGTRKVNGLMLEMVNLAPADRLDDAIHYFAAQAVAPEEVRSAQLDSPTAKKRRFKPARAN